MWLELKAFQKTLFKTRFIHSAAAISLTATVIIERFGAERIDFDKRFILLPVILLSGLQWITFVMQLTRDNLKITGASAKECLNYYKGM